MKELPEWMKKLANEKNNKEFSQLCHDYFKFGAMRVMQEIRDKYNVPKEEIGTLMLAIFARFLNDGCYVIGAAIQNGMNINDILCKEQRLNLLNVLNGEPLDPLKRTDIDAEIKSGLEKFKKLIIEKGHDFKI